MRARWVVILGAALLLPSLPSIVATETAAPTWLVVDVTPQVDDTLHLSVVMGGEANFHLFFRYEGSWRGLSTSATSQSLFATGVRSGSHGVTWDPEFFDPVLVELPILLHAGLATRLAIVMDGPVTDLSYHTDAGTMVREMGRGRSVHALRTTDFEAPTAFRVSSIGFGADAALLATAHLDLPEGGFGFFGSSFAPDSEYELTMRGPAGVFDCPCQFRQSDSSPSLTAGSYDFYASGAGSRSGVSMPILVIAEIPDFPG